MKKLTSKRNKGLVFFYYFSIILGARPFIYDSKTHVLRISTVLSSIGILIYGAAIFSLIPLGLLSTRTMKQSEFLAKDLSTIIAIFSEYASNFFRMTSFILFIKNRKRFLRIFNEILAVDEEVSEIQRSSESENWLTFTVVVKIGVGLIICCLSFCWFLMGFSQLNLLITLLMWSYNTVFLFQIFTICYFNLAIASICKCWKVINVRLLNIYREYKTLKVCALSKEKCAFLCDHLDKSLVLYTKLFKMHENLRHLYEIQITGWAATSFFVNVSTGFIAYTLFFKENVQWTAIALSTSVSVISFLDFFITCYLCESSMKFYADTKNIFGMFNKLRSLDVRLDQTVEYL